MQSHVFPKTMKILNQVKSIYRSCNYTTFDNKSQEIFRLTSPPKKVKVNGTDLKEVADDSSDDWIWQTLDAGGILTVTHTTGNSISIVNKIKYIRGMGKIYNCKNSNILYEKVNRRNMIARGAMFFGAGLFGVSFTSRAEIPSLEQNGNIFNVKDFGASGKREVKATNPIRTAVEACTSAGGVTVFHPVIIRSGLFK